MSASVVSYEDLVPDVSSKEASDFFRTWFAGRDGVVVLTRIAAGEEGARGRIRPLSRAVPADRIADVMSDGLLQEICSDERSNWNSYFSCSTHAKDPTGSGSFRGGKKTIDKVHGLWLDLDVKNAAFKSQAECDSLINAMGLRPTAVVNSGSGGQHAYWRLREPLPKDKGEKLCTAWVARARELSGLHIDRLVTCDRVMRIPGTVRWPKKLGEAPGQVKLRHNLPELMYSVDDVWGLAGQAWDRYQLTARKEHAEVEERKALGQQELARLLDSGGWAGLIGISGFEDSFNANMDWKEILEPHGWVLLGEDGEGRRRWGRPGQDGRVTSKSAHTDYPDSPHVMNLFSDDPSTRLNDLMVSGVDLTKLRVHTRLAYDGDLARLVSDFVGEA